MKNANVSFPNTENVFSATKIKDRNGSVSGNILKRFNIMFDYKKAQIVFTKNNKFKDKFSYNKSGIELAHDGFRVVREVKSNFAISDESEQVGSNSIVNANKHSISLKPAYVIVELRDKSPATETGFKIGDIVLSVNGKRAHELTLHEVMQMFYDEEGKRIRLKVYRNGVQLNLSFKLKSPF